MRAHMTMYRQLRPLGNTDDREIAAPAFQALEVILDTDPEYFDRLFVLRSRMSKLVPWDRERAGAS